ncbi:DUF3179 domain-containing protein [Rubrivirga sp.]|uniref:DUF3179 domain-containing protein n=1 Tax=Rubrivirga sp. TaxID=1885344 RepID=UPI003C70AA47
MTASQSMTTRLLAAAALLAGCTQAQPPERAIPGFDTNTAKRTIDLAELQSGGPPKDGIPALDAPRFVSADQASSWLADREPVVLLRIEDEAKVYPLQILTWHEIVNDSLAGVPVAVTFCPLCYSAVALDRRIEGEDGPQTLSLGVSGLLRFSDMVMYDRQTETLWQQFTGEAIVGDLVGTDLRVLPAQIVSFAQAQDDAPAALVLSRETGYDRDYGRNPYVGYDDIGRSPLFYRGETGGGLVPMERIVAVEVEDAFRAYPASVTRERVVLEDDLGGVPIVVFHTDGAVTALGEGEIAQAREVGTSGVFRRVLEGRTLSFVWEDGEIRDGQTGSRWSVTGEATAGALEGERLAPVQSHDTFAFAWFAFRPETTVYGE